MKAFDDLLNILKRLTGKNGCIWDKKQTISSLKKYILEEALEVKEACDLENREKIKEEVGDLIYVSLFLLKIADIDVKDMLQFVEKKMIRRHPHIFGDEVCKTPEDAVKIWNMMKEKEKSTP